MQVSISLSSEAARAGLRSLSDAFSGASGLALPLLVVLVITLFVLYPDRAIGSSPAPPGIPNGPHALPLVGHTVFLPSKGPELGYKIYSDAASRSPHGIFRWTILFMGTFHFGLRPEYIEYVQKTNFENFVKGDAWRTRFSDLLGTAGIFVADGHAWKAQRKLAVHMFSSRRFGTHIRSVIHNDLKRVLTLLDNIAGPMGRKKLVFPDLLFRFTLGSFAKIAFDADIGCFTEDPISLNTAIPFAVAFDYAQSVISGRFNHPGWQLAEMFTEEGRRMRAACKTVRGFALQIIERRIEEHRQKQRGGYDFGATPRAVKGKGDASREGEDLLDFFLRVTDSPQDLLVVVVNFLIAGRDTTAQSLSWLFYELEAHPEHVAIIVDEVNTLLGPPDDGEPNLLGYDQVKDLPYTMACISEAVRLHPAVPVNVRVAVKDDVIIPQGPNASNLPPVQIRKGEFFGWSDYAMARETTVWGPDAAEFNPLRFLEKGPDGSWVFVQHGQWKFHCFNGGPRLCLGMNLANFEMLAFIAAVLPRFQFSWATREQGQKSPWPPQYAESVTLPIKDFYTLMIAPRQY